jgi:hypothetical protein
MKLSAVAPCQRSSSGGIRDRHWVVLGKGEPMTGWSRVELDRIGTADESEITSFGSPARRSDEAWRGACGLNRALALLTIN